MDCNQVFGSDLNVASNGDVLLTDGETLSQQRVLRRLMTNPGTYIQDLSYGAGVGQFVGQPLTAALLLEIKGLITSQMYLETSVSQNPPPTISITAQTNGDLYCSIQYINAQTTTLQTLSFTVSN